MNLFIPQDLITSFLFKKIVFIKICDYTEMTGKKIKMYYDPRGLLLKTVNSEGSFQNIIPGTLSDLTQPENYDPSPWESYTYDFNDNAGRRAEGPGNTPSNHFNTPKSSIVDSLGRIIEHREHKSHFNGSNYDDVTTKYTYDIQGNVLNIKDPLDRDAFKQKYDLTGQALLNEHIDGGQTITIPDVAGKPVLGIDAKGSEMLSSYDMLDRVIRFWSKDKSSDPFTLKQFVIFGDDLTNTGKTASQTKADNMYGTTWKHFDEAGMIHTEKFDFKGNILEKTKQVIKDSELLSVFSGPPTNWLVIPYSVDWTGLGTSILDSQLFKTNMDYDARNRPLKITYPEDVNGIRKEIVFIYNNGGGLRKVYFDGHEYVKEIAYSASGAQLLTVFANDLMTRYVYDDKTFKLRRTKTEGYNYSQTGSVYTYSPQSGTTKQDLAYEYDLIGNIVRINNCAPDSGYGANPDELIRQFQYDPLYRLIEATGRESSNQNPNILWGDVAAAGSPNASNSQGYTQQFTYDKQGNILQLKQIGNNAFTRNYIYFSNGNKVDKIQSAGSIPSVYSNFVYDVNGNTTGNGTDRNYIWDAADRLKAFYIQAGTSEPSIYAQYLYSGRERTKKIVRTTGGDYEVIVYDGPFEYCKKVSGSTTYEKNYSTIEGGIEIRTGTPFPGDTSANIIYTLADIIGSSTIRLDENGNIIDKEEYYPFGDTSLRTFSKKRYRYGGYGKDEESGLYYYGSRYYSAWMGRFMSTDEIAMQYPSFSPYQYANNNPIGYTDLAGFEGKAEFYEKYKSWEHKSNNITDYYPGLKTNIISIDMSPAKPTEGYSSLGYPKNKKWFWMKMYEKVPAAFSPENVELIKGGAAPIVDAQWVQAFPEHAEFTEAAFGAKVTLEHHHHDQGGKAVAVPKAAHLRLGGPQHGLKLDNLNEAQKATRIENMERFKNNTENWSKEKIKALEEANKAKSATEIQKTNDAIEAAEIKNAENTQAAAPKKETPTEVSAEPKKSSSSSPKKSTSSGIKSTAKKTVGALGVIGSVAELAGHAYDIVTSGDKGSAIASAAFAIGKDVLVGAITAGIIAATGGASAPAAIAISIGVDKAVDIAIGIISSWGTSTGSPSPETLKMFNTWQQIFRTDNCVNPIQTRIPIK